LLLLLSSAACTTFRNSQPEDQTDVVTVMVVNHHALNVSIFSVAQGRRDRLGEVTAAGSASFTLHTRRLPGNELQLRADPIGSSRPVTSELLRVSAGDVVQWMLESDLARSHIAIR
jgi:hypothetical protein